MSEWTKGRRTREIMNHDIQTFTTYESTECPGYLIERWEGNLWGVFDVRKDREPGIFLSSRQRLTDAKEMVYSLSH